MCLVLTISSTDWVHRSYHIFARSLPHFKFENTHPISISLRIGSFTHLKLPMKIHNNILASMGAGKVRALTLLDFSAAFDTMDQTINQSINQTSIEPTSPANPGSVARRPKQSSTANSMK